MDTRQQWGTLSKDKWIHEVVHGKVLTFVSVPTQDKPPSTLNLYLADHQVLDNAITSFFEQKIVEECVPEDQFFISNVFPTIKTDSLASHIKSERKQSYSLWTF